MCVTTQRALTPIYLLLDAEGAVLMSSAIGLSQTSAQDLAFRGLYQYSFEDPRGSSQPSNKKSAVNEPLFFTPTPRKTLQPIPPPNSVVERGSGGHID